MREHEARKAAGLASRSSTAATLRARFGIARSAALLGYGNLADRSAPTTIALLNAAAAREHHDFCPVDIVDIVAKRRGVTATASNGRRIHCRHLVFATGYELPKHVPHKGHHIASTWAIATVPQKRRLWPEQCMIWESSEPYLYLRTTPDGRIICGGEDEEFSDDDQTRRLLARKTETLARKLGELIRGARHHRRICLDRLVRRQRHRSADRSDESRGCRTAGWRSAMAATASPIRGLQPT